MARPLNAQSSTPTAIVTTGRSLGTPVSFGGTSDGPLEITILQMVDGADAAAALAGASPFNQPIIDTLTPVVVTVRVVNRSPVAVHVGNDDFALVGSSGVVRRYLDSRPPEPVLDVTLQPGESAEGNLVFTSAVDEGNRVLISDPSTLGGNWAVRFLALEPLPESPVIADRPAPNAIGADAAAPAGLGDLVVTSDWALTLLDVVSGAAVFDLVDYRTGALGPEDAVGDSDGSIWVALRFSITSVSPIDGLATLPATAFALTDLAGVPIEDMITITPPRPDASGSYAPGGAREGWVAFDVPFEMMPILVRFQPYPGFDVSGDARYFAPGL
ncbi:MAG: hypothetical protein ACKOCK_04330 [Chloroflexota bacterium]